MIPGSVRPDFYDDFVCLAGRCRHTCCRGWEIDVDPATAERYRRLDTPLGRELRDSLVRDGEGVWSLRLTGEGSCPFLRSDGLCRVILELGEDALCDICALHPRFFGALGPVEYAGVGLCCEAACALLLAGRGELTLLTGTDEALPLSRLLALLGYAPPSLTFVPEPSAERYGAILDRYARCEAIDGAWTDSLKGLASALEADPAAVLDRCRGYARSHDREGYDRALQYILYRQLDRLEDRGLDTVLAYAREAAEFLFLWDALGGEPAEHLRRWSAEMEYSTENVELLLTGQREEREG